ncbi:hypothetical protein XELAEV_18016896mg [Xenopus laevis]|uniref:Uncharacterized protein n=1 Tax=Xenopus laevis TaxID=8355 RepID=A0A974HSB5_XENLA|nr:hypothetical protein XELAEV_18016896mg [Xenopus laevis]
MLLRCRGFVWSGGCNFSCTWGTLLQHGVLRLCFGAILDIFQLRLFRVERSKLQRGLRLFHSTHAEEYSGISGDEITSSAPFIVSGQLFVKLSRELL